MSDAVRYVPPSLPTDRQVRQGQSLRDNLYRRKEQRRKREKAEETKADEDRLVPAEPAHIVSEEA